MERGTLLAGVLAGFALSTVTFVVLDRSPPPAVPDTQTHDMLGHMLELLERIERHEAAAPAVAQAASVRQPVLADPSDNVTLAQLLAEMRLIRDRLDQRRLVSEVVPAVMNVGAVRASIELGERDGAQLHSQLVMMSSREVLRRFGRPSGIDANNSYWTYLTPAGERLTLFFAGDLVSDTNTRVERVR